jgi:hypothetical protein
MPPDNAAFYHAAYVAVAVMYLGYTVALLRRRARVREALAAEEARLPSEGGAVKIRE